MEVQGRIGYIRIITFNATVPQEVAEALMDLAQERPQLEGLILDLRDNSGGMVEVGGVRWSSARASGQRRTHICHGACGCVRCT